MALGRLFLVWSLLIVGTAASALAPFTADDAEKLPVKELARQLIGERLSEKVIEAVRTPEYVEFYTQPEITRPKLNAICRTDVITVEYDWSESRTGIARIEARPRY